MLSTLCDTLRNEIVLRFCGLPAYIHTRFTCMYTAERVRIRARIEGIYVVLRSTKMAWVLWRLLASIITVYYCIEIILQNGVYLHTHVCIVISRRLVPIQFNFVKQLPHRPPNICSSLVQLQCHVQHEIQVVCSSSIAAKYQ